jgi:hypothetical protein
MERPEPGAARSAKYLVAERLGRWRVSHGEASVGAFDTVADAARFACDAARLEAQGGVPTVVVVQAAVMEMHCFTPPAAAQAGPRARLRLVGGAG